MEILDFPQDTQNETLNKGALSILWAKSAESDHRQQAIWPVTCKNVFLDGLSDFTMRIWDKADGMN